MKRLTACLAFLLAMSCTPAADAAPLANMVDVDLVSPPAPPAVVNNAFFESRAVVTGDDSADSCIKRHLDEVQLPLPQLPVRCYLVSYVMFWVDLPASQVHDPRSTGGCPARTTTCRFMGQDYEQPYSMAERYDGPSGRHTATVQVWRQVWGDAQPVLLGQDSTQFCLNYCHGR
jgi:hypothetical protein